VRTIRQPIVNSSLTPELIIAAYMRGYFPMAESRDGEIYWHSPDPRAILPIDIIRPPRSLRQTLKKTPFDYRIDSNFETVIRACGKRYDTWISEEIITLYSVLNRLGVAHSVETFDKDELIGGLYGVAIGGAFFGESMFSVKSNASKAAFYYLVERLRERKFILLDTQYLNPFTEQLGAIEISRDDYLILLEKALGMERSFV